MPFIGRPKLLDVSVGTTTLDNSAVGSVQSTTKGILIPAMTSAQRDAIVSPAESLLIYNTTTDQHEFYTGTTWEAMSIPAYTTVQRNALSSPQEGWLIYNTTLSRFEGYIGGVWQSAALQVYTTVQRDALSSPQEGRLIYNQTNTRLELYKSTGWAGVQDLQTGLPVSTVSANQNLSAGNQIVLVDASAAAVTVTLPAPVAGVRFYIKKIDTTLNTVTITPPSGTIDGASSRVITMPYSAVTVTNNGTNFFLI